MAKLSIIIPVFNEAATIDRILERVAAVPIPPQWEREIVVVDDGSTDATREHLRAWESRVHVVYQDRNGGKGTAVLRGLVEATGDYVLVQDADLEYDPEEIPVLLAPVTAGQADVVYGSRTLHPQGRGGSHLAALGVWVLTKLGNMFWRLSLTDICTCYKLFPRDPALWRPGGFESDIRLVAALARRRYRFAEVPITYHPRTRGEGKKIRYRDGLWAIIVMVWDRLVPPATK